MSQKRDESWLFLGGDGLYLSVPFSKEKAIGEIIEDILRYGVIDMSLRQIENTIRNNRGKTVRIAEKVVPFSRDDIMVSLSQDELYVFLSTEPRDNRVRFFEIAAALQSNGVVYGVDYEKIEEIATADDQSCSGVIVAKGDPPVDGQDGRLEYQFDPSESRTPLMLQNGSVDFRQIDVIKCVARDAVLVRRIPATEGKPGRSVRGMAIQPKKGEDVKLPSGTGVYADKLRLELRSSVPGHVYVAGDTVNVEELLIIKGDVDFSVGNLDFKGDAIIRGNVLPDFTVKATGNIEIGGNVEGSTIISHNGSIRVKGGILGRGKARLNASECITTRFADEATLMAQDTVNIDEYIVNCQVAAGRYVNVQQGRGAIVGGRVAAGIAIKAKVLGSQASNVTRILVSVDGGSALVKRLHGLKERLEELNKKKKRSEDAQFEMKRLGDKIWDLPENRRDQVRREASSSREISEDIKKTETAIRQTESDIKAVDEVRIEVANRAYAGVVIQIRDAARTLDSNLNSVVFKLEEGEIKDHSLTH